MIKMKIEMKKIEIELRRGGLLLAVEERAEEEDMPQVPQMPSTPGEEEDMQKEPLAQLPPTLGEQGTTEPEINL